MAADWRARARLSEVDHHGARAGGPSSLRQVFDVLRLPADRWTRNFQLVEANDVGHVAAMRAMGASNEEIAAIRTADRRAQGITAQEEAAGATALARSRERCGGRLLVVNLPHERTATVTDPLALASSQADENILVRTPNGLHFFGDGAAIAALDAAYPGGWRGGELPRRGFWGQHFATAIEEVDVEAVLVPVLEARG